MHAADAQKQIKAQTLIPNAHTSACCTHPQPGTVRHGRSSWTCREWAGPLRRDERRRYKRRVCDRNVHPGIFSPFCSPSLGSALMCQCQGLCGRPAMHVFNFPCKQVGLTHTHRGPRPKHTMSELLPTD